MIIKDNIIALNEFNAIILIKLGKEDEPLYPYMDIIDTVFGGYLDLCDHTKLKTTFNNEITKGVYLADIVVNNDADLEVINIREVNLLTANNVVGINGIAIGKPALTNNNTCYGKHSLYKLTTGCDSTQLGKKYTVEYCKNNKVAIEVTNDYELQELYKFFPGFSLYRDFNEYNNCYCFNDDYDDNEVNFCYKMYYKQNDWEVISFNTFINCNNLTTTI